MPRLLHCRARSGSIRPTPAKVSKRSFCRLVHRILVEWTILAAVLARGGKGHADQARRFGLLASLSRSPTASKPISISFAPAMRVRREKQSLPGRSRTPAWSSVLRRSRTRLRLAGPSARRGQPGSLRRVLTVAYEVLKRYEDEKARRGLLDYDDLIDKTLALLGQCRRRLGPLQARSRNRPPLDRRGSRYQQQAMGNREKAGRRFTAGAGARCVTDVFAVGDEKQSIYSFQDAAPKEFADMLRHFQRAHERCRARIRVPRFEYSFRSGENVLGAVDEFSRARGSRQRRIGHRRLSSNIALPDAPPGDSRDLGADGTGRASRNRRLGRAIRQVSETSPRVKLARRIASAVRQWSNGANRRTSSAPRVMATFWFWCGSAASCSRRSFARSKTKASRWRAPTGLCCPNISRSWTLLLSPTRCFCRRRFFACNRAAQSFVRFRGRRSFRDRGGSWFGLAARRADRKKSEREKFFPPPGFSICSRNLRGADAFCVLRAEFWRAAAGGGASWHGLATSERRARRVPQYRARL